MLPLPHSKESGTQEAGRDTGEGWWWKVNPQLFNYLPDETTTTTNTVKNLLCGKSILICFNTVVQMLY